MDAVINIKFPNVLDKIRRITKMISKGQTTDVGVIPTAALLTMSPDHVRDSLPYVEDE